MWTTQDLWNNCQEAISLFPDHTPKGGEISRSLTFKQFSSTVCNVHIINIIFMYMQCAKCYDLIGYSDIPDYLVVLCWSLCAPVGMKYWECLLTMRTYLLLYSSTCSSVNENTVAAGMGFKVQRRMCTQLCLLDFVSSARKLNVYGGRMYVVG